MVCGSSLLELFATTVLITGCDIRFNPVDSRLLGAVRTACANCLVLMVLLEDAGKLPQKLVLPEDAGLWGCATAEP